MTTFKKSVFIILMQAVGLCQLAHAADPANGQVLARQCSVCHGKTGIGTDPEVPNLAGQPAFYLEKSIKDFQSGARQDRRMTLIVQNLDDNDIKDLAAWYASIVLEVVTPK